MRRSYTIEYKLHSGDEVRTHCLLAKSKEDAYEQATFYDIPFIEGVQPYSSWVASVTYQNGNYRRFNTFEGNPY